MIRLINLIYMLSIFSANELFISQLNGFNFSSLVRRGFEIEIEEFSNRHIIMKYAYFSINHKCRSENSSISISFIFIKYHIFNIFNYLL